MVTFHEVLKRLTNGTAGRESPYPFIHRNGDVKGNGFSSSPDGSHTPEALCPRRNERYETLERTELTYGL